MKKFILLFFLILFAGCTYIETPYDDYVSLVNFPHKEIIDVEEKQINSKDELVSYFESTVPIVGNYEGAKKDYSNFKLQFSSTYRGNEHYFVYINPLSNGKQILNNDIYKSGMPIICYNYGGGWDTGKYNYLYGLSEQPVILIKGKTEWADSSYNGYTILPVANSGDTSELDFTYTIEIIPEQEF